MVRASSKSSSNSVLPVSDKKVKVPVVVAASTATTTTKTGEAVMAESASPEKKPRKSAATAKASALGAIEPPATLAVPPANEIVEASATPEVSIEVHPPSILSSKFAEFGAKLQQTIALLTTLKSEYKSLSKVFEKNQRLAMKKLNDKRKKASGNRQPSGFVKPTRITNELATFLGKSHGTLIARTEVSREINKYIRANSLQDKSNGRKIIPDEKLSALLNISAEDELTYFNLQRFMKHHFIKESKVAASMQA